MTNRKALLGINTAISIMLLIIFFLFAIILFKSQVKEYYRYEEKCDERFGEGNWSLFKKNDSSVFSILGPWECKEDLPPDAILWIQDKVGR